MWWLGKKPLWIEAVMPASPGARGPSDSILNPDKRSGAGHGQRQYVPAGRVLQDSCGRKS